MRNQPAGISWEEGKTTDAAGVCVAIVFSACVARCRRRSLAAAPLASVTRAGAHYDLAGAVLFSCAARALASQIRWHWPLGYHQIVCGERIFFHGAFFISCPLAVADIHGSAFHNCSEWGVNQHRDSLALYVGYDSLTQYIAVAENESIGRVKFNCLQVCRPGALKPAHPALAMP